MKSWPERTGSLTTDGDLERIENHLAFAFRNILNPEALNIKLNSFFKVHLGFFDGFSLADNSQLSSAAASATCLPFSGVALTRVLRPRGHTPLDPPTSGSPRQAAGRIHARQVLWDMSVRTPSTTKSTSFVET